MYGDDGDASLVGGSVVTMKLGRNLAAYWRANFDQSPIRATDTRVLVAVRGIIFTNSSLKLRYVIFDAAKGFRATLSQKSPV